MQFAQKILLKNFCWINMWLGMMITGCAPPPRPEPLLPLPAPPLATSVMPSASPSIPAKIITAKTTQPSQPSYANPWEDPTNPLHRRTIYFDYDTAELKPEFLPLLRTHAHYLGANSEIKIILAGHTDERGTREYNLALGDQRAEAVRRFLLAEGVLISQLTTISYGEERPGDPTHSEAAWRLNRRVVMQYPLSQLNK